MQEQQLFSRAIRYKRLQKGMTLEELGARVGKGLSHATISRYETGSRQPSAKILHQIAEALDTTVEELRALENELRAGEAVVHHEVPVETLPGYVTSRMDISAWRDAVLKDRDLDDFVQVILVTLPLFLDKKHWIVTITTDQFLRETGRSKALVDQYWLEAISSPYVERIGEVEWTLRLRFPPR